MEFQIENTMLFTLATKKKKYLSMNITKYGQDLFEKNYQTLMNKIKDELNKWRDTPCYGEEDSMLSRCQFFPN